MGSLDYIFSCMLNIFSWIVKNWRWILPVLISSLVLYFTVAYHQERRTETILSDINENSLNLEVRVRPYLHSYSSIGRNATIGFRFEEITDNGMYRPIAPPEFHNDICIGEIEFAECKQEFDNEIRVKCNTNKPEKCRSVATSVIDNLVQI